MNLTDSKRIHRIHERARKVKLSEEVGVKDMQAREEKYYEREEGREEGRRAELKDLIRKKLLKHKPADIIADELETDVKTILALIQEIKAEQESQIGKEDTTCGLQTDGKTMR